MKNYLLPLLCLFYNLASQAQYKPGYAGENHEGDLLVSDPLNGKQHFQSFPITLKKGQGVLFFMRSNLFRPYIVLITAGGQLLKQGNINPEGTESQVGFSPDADISFGLLMTSAEENKTGKFNYGYKLLDSSQMVFQESYTTCERLAFLFNQWQLEWQVMPNEKRIFFDLDERLANPNIPIEYTGAKYTLMNGDKARLAENYQEILYSAVRDSTEACLAFYQKIIKDIKSCLDLNSWNIEEGEKKIVKGETELENFFYQTTYFYAKGSNKDGHLQSFKITREGSEGVFSAHNSKVSLVFN